MTFGDFVDIAQVIAMFAALAAVWYAEQAVVETRALRREERVARLLELIADLGDAEMSFARGQRIGSLPDVARLRLKAALDATGEPLPHCRALLDLQWPNYGRDQRADELEARCVAAVSAALDEVSALLVRLREGTTAAAV